MMADSPHGILTGITQPRKNEYRDFTAMALSFDEFGMSAI